MGDRVVLFKPSPITIWSRKRLDKRGQPYEFNHVEIGHNPNSSPTAISDIQAISWRYDDWEKEFGYLDNENKIWIMKIK